MVDSGITLNQLSQLFTTLVNNANMGERVNTWLFYVFFGLLVVIIYGNNMAALFPNIQHLLAGTAGVNMSDLDKLFNSLGGGQTAWTNNTPSPLNPLPDPQLFTGFTNFPTWIYVLGAGIWAIMVLWEVFESMRGNRKTLRDRAWGWLVAPANLVVFFLAGWLGKIMLSQIYGPIVTHLAAGMEKSLGITSEPMTFGNPLWVVASYFGITNMQGGLNIPTIVGNAGIGGAIDTALGMANAPEMDPLGVASVILQHILSPSIFMEVILIFEISLLAIESTLCILFLNLFPLVSIWIVGNPFSFDRLQKFIEVSFRATAGIFLVMVTDLFVAFIDSLLGNGIASIFNGWFAGFLNMVLLAAAIFIIYRTSILSIKELARQAAHSVAQVGQSVQHFIHDKSRYIPSYRAQVMAKYAGNVVGETLNKPAEWFPPENGVSAPVNLARRPEPPFKDEGIVARLDPVTRQIVEEQKFTFDKNTPELADRFVRLMYARGNHELADRVTIPENDPNIRRDENSIYINSQNRNMVNLAQQILSNLKVYYRVGNLYLDENGNAVPENVAKRGIIR